MKILLLLVLLPASLMAYPSRNYRNAHGEWVRKPRHYTRHPWRTPMATCGDGSLSFSHNRKGTCSHHRGVAR